jgi:hypothetical protein
MYTPTPFINFSKKKKKCQTSESEKSLKNSTVFPGGKGGEEKII